LVPDEIEKLKRHTRNLSMYYFKFIEIIFKLSQFLVNIKSNISFVNEMIFMLRIIK